MNRRSFLKKLLGTVATIATVGSVGTVATVGTDKREEKIQPEKEDGFEEIMVPTFEIVASPTVYLSEIKARRFYIVDRS